MCRQLSEDLAAAKWPAPSPVDYTVSGSGTGVIASPMLPLQVDQSLLSGLRLQVRHGALVELTYRSQVEARAGLVW